MDPGHENLEDPPADHHGRSINNINLPSTHFGDDYGRAFHSPVVAWQPTVLQHDNVIKGQHLPLYSRTTTNNFSGVLPIGSPAGNVYSYCGPSNLSCNLDGDSYRHAPPGGPNRALHHGSFLKSSYDSKYFGARRPQIFMNIERHLCGQDLSNDVDRDSFGTIPCLEDGDVFANQDTEGLRMHSANTTFPNTDNIESNGQHHPNSLENSSNTFSSSSAEEFAVASMTNTHSSYSPYELPIRSAATNQSASSNSASHSSSLGEGRLGQSQFIAEQYYPCPSSHLSADSTQEVDGIRLAVSSSDRCSTTNVVTNEVPFYSPSNSALPGENRFEKSCINTGQYFPSSSSSSYLSANTAQEILRFMDSDSDLKDCIQFLDMIYREAVHELTQTSNAAEEVVSQLSSPVESMARLPTELFCKFCYKNKEPKFIYKSHPLQNERGIITCPVLRKYSCPACGATGDFSHTISYCPLTEKNSERSTPFQEMPRSRELPPSHSTPKSTSTSGIGQRPVVIDQWSTALDEDEGFPYIPPSAKRLKGKKLEVCKFCRKNNQPPKVFSSHKLRDEKGNIACPFLRKYVCDICGATGDTAHTRKYCPQNTYEDFIRKLAN